MLTLTMTKGLPGSGKTTWAKEQVLNSNCGTVRVNKDDIRAMMHAGKHSKWNEGMVLRVRDFIVEQSLLIGKHVIVDDTNFEPKHYERMKEIVFGLHQAGVNVVIKEKLFDTPLGECLKRDAKRAEGVGADVIKSMYKKYMAPKKRDVEYKPHEPGLPLAVIVDIDGTLAKMHERGPFEWDKVGQDLPHEDIARLVDLLTTKHEIILMSGRDELCRSDTEAWLDGVCTIPLRDKPLLMRPQGNMEKDSVIKERLYREHIEGKYNVAFVLDDRNQVVDMWRSLGLRCLQVADGDF